MGGRYLRRLRHRGVSRPPIEPGINTSTTITGSSDASLQREAGNPARSDGFTLNFTMSSLPPVILGLALGVGAGFVPVRRQRLRAPPGYSRVEMSDE